MIQVNLLSLNLSKMVLVIVFKSSIERLIWINVFAVGKKSVVDAN